MRRPSSNDNADRLLLCLIMPTTNSVKMFTDGAAGIAIGFAAYKTVSKLVNPKAKKAAGTDVITQYSQAVTRTVNKQMLAVAGSVNKILPEVAQVRKQSLTIPETGIT